MKLFSIASIGLAVVSGAELDNKINKAQNKCTTFMNTALTCVPPGDKTGKYQFRMNKVMFDAKHHLSVGKCDAETDDGGYGDGGEYSRKRRNADDDAEWAALMDEINNSPQGKSISGRATDKQVDKMDTLCRRFLLNVFNDASLKDCGKLGAWKKRATHLADDLRKMKMVCRNMDAYSEDPYAPEGGDGGDPYAPDGGDGGDPYAPEATDKPETYAPTYSSTTTTTSSTTTTTTTEYVTTTTEYVVPTTTKPENYVEYTTPKPCDRAAGEVYKECGTCDPTCDNRKPACQNDPDLCNAGCFCRGNNWFRDANGKCIKEKFCPATPGY